MTINIEDIIEESLEAISFAGKFRHLRKSLYKSKRMSVSGSVYLFVCMFVPYLLRNGEPQRAEILRDDFPWDGEGFRLKNIRIR